MPNQKNRTWIVAASRTAAWMIEESQPQQLQVVAHLEQPLGDAKAQDLDTDREGMRPDPFGHGASFLDPQQGPTERILQDFSRRICEDLRIARGRGAFSELILMADPSFLGALRSQLDDATSRLLTVSVNKNLPLTDEREVLEAVTRELSAVRQS